MPSNFDLGTSERKKYDKHRFDDTFVSQTKTLTFLDALLRLFSFPEGLATIANVYIAIEVLLAIDVFVGGLDQLGAREYVGLHQARCLLDSLGS